MKLRTFFLASNSEALETCYISVRALYNYKIHTDMLQLFLDNDNN